MRLPLLAPALTLALAALTIPVCAGPARVTVVTRDGRHGGTLSVDVIEVQNGSRAEKVPLAEVALIQFAETDFVRTRRGQRVKGVVRVDGWSLKTADAEKPLARSDLKFVVPHAALGTPKKGQVVDAASANGMTYHVRVPEKYDPKVGRPAIVMFHGSNANSADYLKGITQRWPKVASDYVLIGIDGEWPNLKNPDGPPAFNYTYVNFVGKSKYKGFPGTDRESPALVAETVSEIREQLKLTKVFIAGHSQGGFLVYSCLMNYPDLFAGGMPMSAGLIFQCEPTAYEDAEIRDKQRKRPIAIVHGDSDPLVGVGMGRSAHDSFLRDGFPMLRLLIAKGAAHAFVSLPFEDGIRWLESMTSDDPKALMGFAEQAFARREYRDASAYLRRLKEVDTAGKQSAGAGALRRKIEQLAAASAKKLQASIPGAEGSGWESDFDGFRRQFEFTDAAAPVMAEYGKLRKVHEPAAEKLWTQARAAFQAGNKGEGYRLCQEIVGKYGASSYYSFAKQTLDGRK